MFQHASVFLAADGELSRPTGRRRHSSTTRRVQRPTSGRRKTRATPTPTSRGQRSSNALHLTATSARRQQPAVADKQLSYSSDVPEPRSTSDGGDETTTTATTGCRPATAPGTAQRPPARTRDSETRNSESFLLVRCLAVISQRVHILHNNTISIPAVVLSFPLHDQLAAKPIRAFHIPQDPLQWS